jgi:WS/DGAT/MGAT family acyltransferase
MAVGGVLVFAAGDGVSHDAIISRLEGRLHLIPRYRQRLQQPTPGGFTNPVWIDDKGFDAGWHVRRAATDDVARLMGIEMSRKLDRSRPLWEMTVVDGFAPDRVALLPKMHHALVDGVAAVDVGTVILDPTPEPMDLTPDSPWQPKPYDRRRHLTRLAAAPMFSAQRLFLQGAERALTPSTPFRAAGDLRKATALLAELARNRPQAPMTFLNRPIGPNRRYAMARAPLAELKTAAKAAGGTVNDAILAAVAGMLGRLFELTGERPSRPPVALVPVSVRQQGEEGGNRISTVLVDLPALTGSPRSTRP